MSKLFIIGIGPGSPQGFTAQAIAALEQSDAIYGYTAYTDLVLPLFPQKEIVSTGMTQEVQRCRLALEAATAGKNISVVCSGDPGVYGMAGLIYQLAAEMPEADIEIEVVAGVTAASSGAAVLGAPLMNDFAVISLSDLLTPWEVIEKRLDAAAAGDFAICLYNPSSKKRGNHLRTACEIMLRHKSPDTICGWVRNIGRQGEESGTLSLAQLCAYEADMFTTVFIGSSSTYLIDGKMITPRGYEKKWL